MLSALAKLLLRFSLFFAQTKADGNPMVSVGGAYT